MNQAVIEDPLHKFDHETGVFRDVRFVHSKLRGLFITHENIEEFLRTSATIRDTELLVRFLLKQLKNVCLVKGHVLNDLEVLWTDTERKDHEVLRPEELFYTIVTVTFYLTPDWEPTRELNYLAVSQELIRDSIQYFLLSPTHAHHLEMSPTFTDLHGFKDILRMSAENNLVACLYNLSLRSSTENSLDQGSSNFAWKRLPNEDMISLTFPLSSVLRPCIRPPGRSLICSLYHMYKVGANEPNVPFLRVSSALDQVAAPEELRSDLVDKTNWPWKNDQTLKRLREANKSLIVAMPQVQGTYYKSNLCIFILNVNPDMPAYDIFKAPDTFIMAWRFNKDPENGHWPWKTEPLDEVVPTWQLSPGVQLSNGKRFLIEYLDAYSQHLKKPLGNLSISTWAELAKGLVFVQNAEPLGESSDRPFKRSIRDSSTNSRLLELGWHRIWMKGKGSQRGQVNRYSDNIVEGSAPAPTDKAAKSMRGPISEVDHVPSCNNQDNNGQTDAAVMSERRRRKRPMRAVDESDEAESSAHAERRARQEREVAQRFNTDFLSDEELEEVLARGTLS